jgi:signal transduction histidine kinase
MEPIAFDEVELFAHALRTPLAAIGGFVQLLELGMHGPITTAQATALERIRLNQEQAVALIAEFMARADRDVSAQS